MVHQYFDSEFVPIKHRLWCEDKSQSVEISVEKKYQCPGMTRAVDKSESSTVTMVQNGGKLIQNATTQVV